MIKPKTTFLLAIGILSLFASIVLLIMFGNFQQIFLIKGALSTSNPLGIMAIFAITIIGGIYFLKAAGSIITGVVK
ncbi:MAG: hypothetical protein NUV57_01395 [archaeon]|nr:hypothetical protein [archaeon]